MGIKKYIAKKLYKGGKSIIDNKGDIKKIIRTIKNPPQGGMVDKLISSLQKEFGIPLKRINKMINKKNVNQSIKTKKDYKKIEKEVMNLAKKTHRPMSAGGTVNSRAIAKKYFKGGIA